MILQTIGGLPLWSLGSAENADNVDGADDDYTAQMYAAYDFCMSDV